MNKTIVLSLTLFAILSTSCLPTKQTSRKVAAAINWTEYNSFKFDKTTFDSVPDVIGQSIIQEIEEGITSRFDGKGIAVRDTSDLLVNLHFSFDNPQFIDNKNMSEVMTSLKYTTSGHKKLTGYYKDGVVTMDVVSAKTGETIWSSTAKGFVNTDGSEVGLGSIIENISTAVSNALFKGFPKTGKPSIASIKRKEAKEREKAIKKMYYGN